MRLILAIAYSLLGLGLQAQDAYFQPANISGYQNVDMDTLGTLEELVEDSIPFASVYRDGLKIYAVKKGEKGIAAWSLSYNDHITKIHNHDFNGGWPELVIHWQFLAGNSSWGGGMAEQSELVEVYDLENARVLLSLDTYMFLETWSNQFLYEREDTNLPDPDSHIYTTTQNYCQEWQVTFRDSVISIIPVQDQRCDGIKSEEELDAFTLVWRRDAFYRKD